MRLTGANVANDPKSGRAIVGTKEFMAPEIFEQGGAQAAYKEPVDVWAAGVLMFNLLAGYYPFNQPDIEQEIQNDPVLFASKRFEAVSPDALNLIEKMLEKSPVLRPTPTQCLQHPFFKDMHKKQGAELAAA